MSQENPRKIKFGTDVTDLMLANNVKIEPNFGKNGWSLLVNSSVRSSKRTTGNGFALTIRTSWTLEMSRRDVPMALLRQSQVVLSNLASKAYGIHQQNPCRKRNALFWSIPKRTTEGNKLIQFPDDKRES